MKYGLIGGRLGHSWSKPIHESFGFYDYELCELAPEELPSFFEKKEFSGINVTMPYKRDVIKYLDELSPEAEAIGAVNCISNKDGYLKGYNTDCSGFMHMLKMHDIDVAGKKVLILGTGGASAACEAGAKIMGAGKIIYVSRSGGRPNTVSYEEAKTDHCDAQVIINATPVGMYPKMDVSPIDLTSFKNLEGLADIIYNPPKTMLVKQAEELGVNAATGLDMLIGQAVVAAEHFLGIKLEPEVYKKASVAVEKMLGQAGKN